MRGSVADLEVQSIDLVDVIRALDCGCAADDCDCPVVDAHHSVLSWGRARERDPAARGRLIGNPRSPSDSLPSGVLRSEIGGRRVRIMPLGDDDPGGRLRLELDPGSGMLVLSDENVFPEQVDNPDARNRIAVATIDLILDMLRWIVRSGDDLLREIELDDSSEEGVP
jgi:hypothetical protein